jgi:hypothetical protein
MGDFEINPFKRLREKYGLIEENEECIDCES